MSTQNNGRTIHCDGPNCVRTARGVVSLHPTSEQQRETWDWLFTYMEGAWRHYCPLCSPKFLAPHLITATTVPANPARDENRDEARHATDAQ